MTERTCPLCRPTQQQLEEQLEYEVELQAAKQLEEATALDRCKQLQAAAGGDAAAGGSGEGGNDRGSSRGGTGSGSSKGGAGDAALVVGRLREAGAAWGRPIPLRQNPQQTRVCCVPPPIPPCCWVPYPLCQNSQQTDSGRVVCHLHLPLLLSVQCAASICPCC